MQSRRDDRLVVVESRSRSRSRVARGVLFDVDIALRDVRFRLVVIVIADEVLDRVLGEELLELLVELGGQGLVVRDDQHGPVELGDDVGHREGLAAAGHAHQGLELLAFAQTLRQPLDGLRLVARRLKLVIQLECTHFSFAVNPTTRRVLNPCSCCSYALPQQHRHTTICCAGQGLFAWHSRASILPAPDRQSNGQAEGEKSEDSKSKSETI